MRKILGMAVMAIVPMMAISCSRSNETYVTDMSALPDGVTAFVADNFGDASISNAKAETEAGVTEYELILSDGTKVEMRADGTIIEVEAPRGRALPTSFIPHSVVEYVTVNYPNDSINSYEVERRGHKVELVSGLELKFDPQGNFVSIDR